MSKISVVELGKRLQDASNLFRHVTDDHAIHNELSIYFSTLFPPMNVVVQQLRLRMYQECLDRHCAAASSKTWTGACYLLIVVYGFSNR